jgi:hypothetical protein
VLPRACMVPPRAARKRRRELTAKAVQACAKSSDQVNDIAGGYLFRSKEPAAHRSQ